MNDLTLRHISRRTLATSRSRHNHGGPTPIPSMHDERGIDAPTPWRMRCSLQCLSLLEGGDARQHLALEQLERRATARRDVRHLLGEARLLDGGHRVTAADDGGAAL